MRIVQAVIEPRQSDQPPIYPRIIISRHAVEHKEEPSSTFTPQYDHSNLDTCGSNTVW